MSHQAAHNLPHDQLLNAYWVVPGRLLAGPYPSAPALPDAQKQVAALLALGIDYIVDLTEPGEYGLRAYWPLLLEASMAQGLTIERRQWSIPDMSVPTQEQMRATLDDIDAALASGRTVYIHCFGGIGRTGMVVGCYPGRGGARGHQALATNSHLCRTLHQPHRRAPCNGAERAMGTAAHRGASPRRPAE